MTTRHLELLSIDRLKELSRKRRLSSRAKSYKLSEMEMMALISSAGVKSGTWLSNMESKLWPKHANILASLASNTVKLAVTSCKTMPKLNRLLSQRVKQLKILELGLKRSPKNRRPRLTNSRLNAILRFSVSCRTPSIWLEMLRSKSYLKLRLVKHLMPWWGSLALDSLTYWELLNSRNSWKTKRSRAL